MHFKPGSEHKLLVRRKGKQLTITAAVVRLL
jgi:hypothetical protein